MAPEVRPDYRPTRKVTAGAVGGALATVLAWIIGAAASVDVPPGVEAAFATILSFAAAWLRSDA